MPQYGPVGDLSLQGKVVCITGGGSGIGFAFAQQCHSAGARVMIGDLKMTADAEAYLSSVHNHVAEPEIAFQKCDVTSWRDLHELISASVRDFGQVPDVYAPVAGIFEPPWSNFWDDESLSSDSYKTLRINVDHPIKLTRLAMRALAGARKRGVVVLVASTAGIRANYLASLYTASKHAIVGFAKSMGQADSEEGVRVVCVLPGMVSSPLWHDRQDDLREAAKFAERRFLEPDDVADLMVRMVQQGNEYEGGTCVLKTPYEEKIVEEGHTKLVAKMKEYDPSPRPEPDIGRTKQALEKERGREWT